MLSLSEGWQIGVKMVDSSELSEDELDRSVAAIRGVLGAVPFVGTMLGEIVSSLIPAQRLDRFSEYLRVMSVRLDAAEVTIEELRSNPNAIALIEDGGYQAVRATSEKRIKAIVACVAKGLSMDEEISIRRRQMLDILGLLSDKELIILAAYDLRRGINESFGVFQKIGRPSRIYSEDPEHVEQVALWEASLIKLEQNGLLGFRSRMSELGIPKTDNSGKREGHYHITQFGRRFLQVVELAAD